ncbi:metal ABC transporter ATP-binding protein [Halomonas sp. Mc5H-6]|uniref:ATP-binding cassette domain-containing protein n=1 Tax=Halomonas sp. Mc5H-6 TaxID=2954500 RepID=UPI002096E063|nr:metal ABC transporter ATP-binding protein [Halomonas sp. Mc5H-6]MCO7245636.1 metal ABC transporter ATP-binding protein [Halomonas sp. Mc5H-6]
MLQSITPSAPLLRACQLNVRIGGKPILEDIHLALHREEIVTLIGPNGSGKSTLVKTLVGAIKPTSGRLEIDAGLNIGYVPQRLHLDPTLPITVSRFINLPHRHPRDDVPQALTNAGVEGLHNAAMSQLSGGQLQRVLLARALINRPDILILDEATQGLDHRGIADFYQKIEEVRQSYRCAILMVSHDLHVVMRTADHVLCLNGHICCEGKPERVASSPDYQALFGEQTAQMLAVYRHQHEEAAHAG